MDIPLINTKLAGIDQLVSEIRTLVNEVPVPPDPPEPPLPGDDAIISRMVGTSLLTIRGASKYAGAIDFLIWNGKEFVSRTCTGDLLQTALACNDLAERYNPTEAGNRSGEPSKLISMTANGNVLNTKCQMAFYLSPGEVSNPNGEGPQTLPAVNTTELSDYILTKKVTIGHASSDHVIEFLLNIHIPEPCNTIIEALTGYMPAEFSSFYTYNHSTRELYPISEGPGEQQYPLVFASGDTHAMGCYCPDLPIQNQYKYLGYGRSAPPWVADGMVKWNMVFRMNGLTPGDYAFRCYVMVGTLENVRVSMVQLHNYFGGVTPTPPTPPPGDEIKDFNRLPECDNPSAIYFSAGNVNGDMHVGEYGYQNGRTKSSLWKYPHSFVRDFDCEAIFDLCMHKGINLLALERGGWGSEIDRGMIYRLSGNSWIETYRHPSLASALKMKSCADGYVYATLGESSVRSLDGITWGVYNDTPGYCQWDVTDSGADIWIAGAYGGDYGPGCHPVVWKNRSMVWDSLQEDAGFLGIAAFNGNIFLAQANPAQIIRFSDKKVVLNRPGQAKFTKLVIDEFAKTLYAITCVPDSAASGAEVWSTKDGNAWKQMPGPYSVPHLFNAYYNPSTKEIWLTGGKWSQRSGGYGRIYKSVR